MTSRRSAFFPTAFLLVAAGGWLGASACKSGSQPAPQPSLAPDPSAGGEEPTEDGNDTDVDGGSTMPTGNDETPIPTKIRYVLVLVKENHTFDNYFTGFPGAESSTTAKTSTGKTLTRPTAPDAVLAKDPCHTNPCGQTAYAKGALNGFDKVNSGQANLPFIRYTEQQIPNYWQYARNFVLADHFFSTTLGPSTPGHAVFWTARSLSLDNASCNLPGGTGCTGFGCTASKDVTITSYDPDACTTKKVAPCFDVPSLTDHLPAGFTWTDYGGPLAQMVKSVTDDPAYQSHFRKQADIVGDLTAGHLANLTIGHLWSGDVSEHPTAYPCAGEGLSVDIINAAMKLPQWKEMAIVITWDDWGGFYDHIAPTPVKCSNGQVFQTGFRLPMILVSPYAKKGYVLKTPTEQASVPRMVEELWGMDFMTKRDKHARDETAGSLMEAFDFNQPARDPLPLTKRVCPAQ